VQVHRRPALEEAFQDHGVGLVVLDRQDRYGLTRRVGDLAARRQRFLKQVDEPDADVRRAR
jgi:hypothetical protein